MHPRHLLAVLFTPVLVLANVEKTIFLGPSPPPAAASAASVASVPPSVPRLAVDGQRTLRTRLNTSFAGAGAEHWFLLDRLQEGRRYEVRVCWPATPTDFELAVFPFGTGEGPLEGARDGARAEDQKNERSGSLLYLRIHAKAAYYSKNRARMLKPEPVDVELVLDPFVFNVIPESLLPVGAAVVVVAVGGWFLSRWAAKWLQALVMEGMEETEGKKGR